MSDSPASPPASTAFIAFAAMATIISMVTVLASCESGYTPVDRTKKRKGEDPRWLRGKNDSIRMVLDGQIKNDTGNFSFMLALFSVSRTGPLRLSNVRVAISDLSSPPGSYVLQKITFSHHHPKKIYREQLDSITGPRLLERQDFDLPDDGRYFVSYFFLRREIRRYSPKMTVKIEAELSGKGITETFHDSVVFRRYSSFSIYH